MRASAALSLALVVAASLPARGEVVEGSVTSLLAGRADPRDGNVYSVVPLYQSLWLSLRDVRLRGVDDLRVEVNVWGGAQLLAAPGTTPATGDIDVAYAEGKLFRRRLEVRLGRQVLAGGVLRFTHLDGAAATVQVHRGFRVLVFGGVPVVPRFAVKLGDVLAGGRASYRLGWSTELGLSFVHLHDLGRAARQDLGFDYRARPHRQIVLTGLGVLSILERRLVELDFAGFWQPTDRIDIRLGYRRQAPDLFLPRSSIFSVFAPMTRDEVGGSIDARPLRRVGLVADYHTILDATGTGHRAGLRAQIALGPLHQLVVGSQLRLLLLPTKGYYEARLFARWRLLPTLTISADADAYLFDRPVNGRSFSFTGAASLAWDFARAWRVVASAAGSSTPFVEGGFDAMLKLAYNPIFRFREATP